MKLVYRPFGLVVSVLAGTLAGLLFKRAWRLVAGDEAAPDATDKERGWSEIILAATLQGAVFGGVKAAIDRAGASGFAKVTGVWPGDEAEPTHH